MRKSTSPSDRKLEKKPSFIGVDLHTDNFTTCTLTRGKQKIFKTYTLNDNGLMDFKSSISKLDKVAVEATANSYFFCQKIKRNVRSITIVAPSEFSIIGKSTKKTDLQDAHKLALFLSKNMLPKARLKAKIYYQISSLSDSRAQFVRMRSALIRRVHAIAIRNGLKINKNRLSTKSGFEKYVFSRKWNKIDLLEIRALHSQIVSLRESSDFLESQITQYAQKLYGYENLLSIKGIGPLSAAVLLCVIGNINDFKRPKNLCSYFGIVPRISQSNNTLIQGRITKVGSKSGRATLVQCSVVAIKYSPYLRKFYERLRAKKGYKKAIVATARKLLTIIFFTLRDDIIFEDFEKYKYSIRNSG